MDATGTGGRGALEYGNPVSVLDGVLKTDPPAKRKDDWNKPKIGMTPFGRRNWSRHSMLVTEK